MGLLVGFPIDLQLPLSVVQELELAVVWLSDVASYGSNESPKVDSSLDSDTLEQAQGVVGDLVITYGVEFG